MRSEDGVRRSCVTIVALDGVVLVDDERSEHVGSPLVSVAVRWPKNIH